MSDKLYQLYSKRGGDGYVLTLKPEADRVFLESPSSGSAYQAWSKVEIPSTSLFVLVNPVTNQAIKVPGKPGDKLLLIPYVTLDDETIQWTANTTPDPQFYTFQQGKNPDKICWTVNDENGLPDATIVCNKIDGQGNEKQLWAFKANK